MNFQELEDKVKKLSRNICCLKTVLSSSSALTGSAGTYLIGIDNTTGNLYYSNSLGNWTLVPGGSGGGVSSFNTFTGSVVLQNGTNTTVSSPSSGVIQVNAPTPTIDEVLTSGNFSAQSVTLGNLFLSDSLTSLSKASSGFSGAIAIGGLGTGSQGRIFGDNLTSTITLEFPQLTGSPVATIVTSVNGVRAGTNGNITLSAGGSVTSVTSANTDISVATGTTTPVLTLNSGSGANQIAKRDGSGNFNATTVTTNANLTGDVTSIGNASTIVSINSISPSFYDPTSSIQTQLNSKLSANQAIVVTATGDATGTSSSSGTAPSLPLVLATVNSNVGTFGAANTVGQFTVNAKGLITAASSDSIQITESQVTNLTTDLAGKQATITLTTIGTSGAATLVGPTLNIPNYAGSAGNLTGDITSVGLATTYNNVLPSTKGGAGSITGILKANGSGTVSQATAGTDYLSVLSGDTTTSGNVATLATVNSNTGSFGTATSVPTYTVNGKGLITASANTAIQITESQVTNLTTDLAAKANASYTPLGTIINETFTGSLVNFTTVGSPGASIVSNQLQLSTSPGSISLGNYLTHTYGITNLESWQITANITVPTLTTTSFGVAFGLQGPIGSTQVGIALDSVNFGKISFYNNNSVTGGFSSPSQLSITAGDILNIKIKLEKDRLLVSLTNQTTNAAIEEILPFKMTYPGIGLVAAVGNGAFSIYSLGGTILIDNFVVSSTDSKNADLLVIGDSITKGYVAPTGNRWLEKIQNQYEGIYVANATGGAKIENIVASEVISLTPKKILIDIGTNNVGAGDSTTTYNTKLATLVSSFTTAGYVVGTTLFFTTLLPRTSTDTSIYNTGILSTYGTAVIDQNLAFRNPTGTGPYLAYVGSDGLHPSIIGHQRKADIISAGLGLKEKINYKTIASSPTYDSKDGYIQLTDSLCIGSAVASAGSNYISAGSFIDNTVGLFRAINTSATLLFLNPSLFSVNLDTGLTVGNTYTSTPRFGVTPSGVSLGGTNLTAGFNTQVLFPAGTSLSSGARFVTGTDMTVPNAGAWTFSNSRLAFSPSTTFKRVTLTNDVTPANGQIPIGNATDYTVATPTGTQGVTVTTGAGTLAIGLGTITPTNYYTTSAIPTIVAGTGAGGSPTVSIATNSTNAGGVVNVTTGTLPTLSGIVATITFSASFAFPHGSSIMLYPANGATAALSGTSMVFANGTTTTFVITAGTVALTAATAYSWNYQVTGF